METQIAADLLDAEAISRAEALGLHARYVVEGYMSGEHKSPYRGFAVEFAQHREYAPGDDTRHVDWKVEARTDRLFVKQYEQETNYVANILLDGADISFTGLLQECPMEDVRVGMRVEAVWRDSSEWDYSSENIKYFRPIDEPDVPFEDIKEYC